MALPTGNHTQPAEDSEFQQLVCQIGGKERIYLVTDACRADGEDEVGILQEFLHDMFCDSLKKNCNGEVHPALRDTASKNLCKTDLDSVSPHRENETPISAKPKDLGVSAEPVGKDMSPRGVQRTKTSTVNTRGSKRTIDSPMIIFIFSQDFVRESSNEMCLKEILKDVRARSRRAPAWPALIGLIGSDQFGSEEVRSEQRSAESSQAVRVLERALRSVFRQHAPETIWVGHFIPKTHEAMAAIKKHACRALSASLTSDRAASSGSYWPFPCVPWLHSRRRSGQAHAAQHTRQPGDRESLEEGIPLKTKVPLGGPHMDCGTVEMNGNQP